MARAVFSVAELFPTYQGEGRHAGRRAVFLRLSGCNLWDGVPEHRDRGAGACARWCDTSFATGFKRTPSEIVTALEGAWGDHPRAGGEERRMVVVSGGEPTLQLDDHMVSALQANGWYVAVETNGTVDSDALKAADWVTCSPKLGAGLALTEADELKVVLPGHVDPAQGWTEAALRDLARRVRAHHLWVQPMDPSDVIEVEQTYLHAIGRRAPHEILGGLPGRWEASVRACTDFIERNPTWRLSTQTHKYLNFR